MSETGPDKPSIRNDAEISSSNLNDTSDREAAVPTVKLSGNAFIHILPGSALEVDRNGEIVGPKSEGTLGIVLYAVDPSNTRTERAIRLPRLLQSDILLNFHVAEIVYYESRQAYQCRRVPNVLKANNFFRLEERLNSRIISRSGADPEMPQGSYFIGFYLSPTSPYQVCLVWENAVWPDNLREHLERINRTPKELYEKIKDGCEAKSTNVFSRLLSMPNRTDHTKAGGNDDFFIESVGRERLDSILGNRELGRWWFNIPVATYDWMTASLERLLTGFIDEDSQESEASASLRKWALGHWFDLMSGLTFGLKGLHQEGFIHGDPRPANIMTYVQSRSDIEPKAFYWIDIGLGYGADEQLGEKFINVTDEKVTEPSSITPRPLGGGRMTVFYAPERDEALEFEDADMVKLHALSPHRSRLEFSWRKQTNLGPLPLPLVEIERDHANKEIRRTPLRELGKLVRGDRVQVREFLFEVEKVEEAAIEISRIYEIFLDRVLVEKKGKERTRVHKHLEDAPISRYRIFQQWSQATDVYGLGIITLYVFFIRGLYELKSAYENASKRNPIYERANREIVFEELASLLRNRSFLERLLFSIKSNGFDDPAKLLKAEIQQSGAEVRGVEEAFENISKIILATDYNYEFVWHGVDQNHQLFVLVVYFCLCCVWRQQEVFQIEIEKNTGFPFEAFSFSRLAIDGAPSPSETALAQEEGSFQNAAQLNTASESPEVRAAAVSEEGEEFATPDGVDMKPAAASSKAVNALESIIKLLPRSAWELTTDKRIGRFDRSAGGLSRADQLIELRQRLDNTTADAMKIITNFRAYLALCQAQINDSKVPFVVTKASAKKWINDLGAATQFWQDRFESTTAPAMTPPEPDSEAASPKR